MIQKVVSRARRRLLWNALAAEAARAAIAGLAVLILLLLAGTDRVGWRWIAVVPAVVFAAGTCLIFRRRPTLYAAARRLDQRLCLADTLSTAIYYWPAEPPRRCDDRMRARQRERASQAAASIDVRAAISIRVPGRFLAGAAALLLIASAVLMLRNRFDYRIDLRASAGATIRAVLRSLQDEIAALEQSVKTPPEEKAAERAGKSESTDRESADDRRADADSSRGNQSARSEEAQAESEKPPERKADQAQAADSSGDPENRRASSSQDGNTSPRADSSAAERSAEQSGSSSSLMAKLSDAVSKLASALKPASGANPQRGGGQSQTAQATQQSKDASEQSASGSASRSAGQEGSPEGANGSAGSARGSEQANQKQAGSGAGSEDGDKEIRDAAQLDAMGKISVILGKRSKDLTGEVYSEVTSGAQQLSTPYVQRGGQHADTHARADRDEIPLGFQDYVERYFQELRWARGAAPRLKSHETASMVKR